MSTTTVIVLGTTVNGTPSGNYDGSSLDFVSDAAKSVGYYRGQGSLQTLIIQVTAFDGIIKYKAVWMKIPLASTRKWAGQTYTPTMLPANQELIIIQKI